MEEKIKQELEKVRPALQEHGGDVEFVKYDAKNGFVYVRLRGMCVGCPMAQQTLHQGIEEVLKANLPEIKKIILAG